MDNSANKNTSRLQDKSHVKRQLKKASPKRRVVVQLLGGIDRPFLVTVILLLCLGTVMVFSASYPYANANFNGDSYYFAKKQITFVLIGIAIMLAVANTGIGNYHFLRKFSKAGLLLSILLLIAVLFVGQSKGGATRWFKFGPINFQPSEIVKFALVLFFADYADKYAEKICRTGEFKNVFKIVLPFLLIAVSGAAMLVVFENKIIGGIFAFAIIAMAVVFMFMYRMRDKAPAFYYGVLPYVVVLAIVGVFLYMQPHVSGLIIMAGITFAMMFMGGTNLGYLLAGGAVGIVGILGIALTLGHSSSRLAVWKDPFSHLLNGGWQPAQSLYAIGSGGFWGVGFGNSRQKHLYLPEPQNDYIFSIWCEEMGFIGAILVICIFMFFIYRGILIGLRAPDRFSSLLVIGIIAHVGIQMILNIAVVTNTLPSTGISLPFFSYGGTSLIILLAEMGVVLAVSRYSSVEKS